MYDGFREDSTIALSWDAVILMRRLMITSVTILFATDAYLQALGASVMTMAFMSIHIYVLPFTDPLHNACETLGLITVLLTQMGSLLYFYVANKSDVAWWDDGVALGATATLLSLNIGTVVFLAVSAAWFGRVKVMKMVEVLKSCSCCKRGGKEMGKSVAELQVSDIPSAFELVTMPRQFVNPLVIAALDKPEARNVHAEARNVHAPPHARRVSPCGE